MPQIQIPASFRSSTEGHSAIALDGDNVAALLAGLVGRFPKLQSSLFNQAGELHSYVNLFVDGQSIRDLQLLETPVMNHQTLLILAALSGG